MQGQIRNNWDPSAVVAMLLMDDTHNGYWRTGWNWQGGFVRKMFCVLYHALADNLPPTRFLKCPTQYCRRTFRETAGLFLLLP